MNQLSAALLDNPMSIISPLFCAPSPVDLAVVRKVLGVPGGSFVVTDIYGNLIFKVKRAFIMFRDRRILHDAAGNPIVTLQKKLISAHQRWEIFRGESTDLSDLLFSVRKSSRFQFNTKLDVFLANNIDEQVCDFKVHGSRFGRSCEVYAGDSSTAIVAQMHKKPSAQSIFLGKDKFMVTVYPKIDYAFIVALIVILDDISSPSRH